MSSGSRTAYMLTALDTPRPEADDYRLVLNVQIDKSQAFQNKPKLTSGFPPVLAGIIKKDSARLLAALSGLAI